MNFDSLQGKSEFARAVMSGDVFQVRITIKRFSPSPYVINTGLVTACEYGFLDIVKYLLKTPQRTPADIHFRRDRPLRWASSRGQIHVVKFLVERPDGGERAFIHAEENSALISACERGFGEVVHYLISHGANVHSRNEAPLISACAHGYLDVAQFLITRGDANARAQDDGPLRIAARNGRLGVVQYLVEQCSCDVNAVNGDVLACAASEGHLHVVKYLIEKGANSHIGNELALRIATENGHIEIIKYLMERPDKADVNASDGIYGGAICVAAHYGRLDIIKHLIEIYGADVHIDDDGALVGACEYGHIQVVRYLIEEAGSNHAACNYLALTKACEQGRCDIVMYLVEKYGIPNNECLQIAAAKGRRHIVKYLAQKSPAGFFNEGIFRDACTSGDLETIKSLSPLISLGSITQDCLDTCFAYSALEANTSMLDYLYEQGASCMLNCEDYLTDHLSEMGVNEKTQTKVKTMLFRKPCNVMSELRTRWRLKKIRNEFVMVVCHPDNGIVGCMRDSETLRATRV